ncbi:MAG TPA: hypothetical protein VJC05_00800 [Candidatus Andersenbacteria bacterium]|nr:hypothetical protein [Candidatus Andersenbacteria bacterium]
MNIRKVLRVGGVILAGLLVVLIIRTQTREITEQHNRERLGIEAITDPAHMPEFVGEDFYEAGKLPHPTDSQLIALVRCIDHDLFYGLCQRYRFSLSNSLVTVAVLTSDTNYKGFRWEWQDGNLFIRETDDDPSKGGIQVTLYRIDPDKVFAGRRTANFISLIAELFKYQGSDDGEQLQENISVRLPETVVVSIVPSQLQLYKSNEKSIVSSSLSIQEDVAVLLMRDELTSIGATVTLPCLVDNLALHIKDDRQSVGLRLLLHKKDDVSGAAARSISVRLPDSPADQVERVRLLGGLEPGTYFVQFNFIKLDDPNPATVELSEIAFTTGGNCQR